MQKRPRFDRVELPLVPAPMWLIVLLAMNLLACSMGNFWGTSSDTIWIKRTYPTFTPTAAAYLAAATDPSPAKPVEVAELSEDSAAGTTLETTSNEHLVPTVTPTAPPAQIYNSPLQTEASSNQAQAEASSGLPATGPVSNPSPISTRIPMFGSIPNRNAAPSSSSPAATSAANSPATPTPIPTGTAPSAPPVESEPVLPPVVDGWSFVGVRASLDQEDSVVVGELVNNTGIPQTEIHVSGVFYGARDKIIKEEIETLSYVPVEVVPVGAHVPFELIIESPEPIYRLDLYAMSEPSGDPPDQDFLFSNVSHWVNASNMYCLGGQIQNTASHLEDYLIILASAYNDQGQLASFGEYSVVSPENVTGDQASLFEMCIDPLDQPIAKYELWALGR